MASLIDYKKSFVKELKHCLDDPTDSNKLKVNLLKGRILEMSPEAGDAIKAWTRETLDQLYGW